MTLRPATSEDHARVLALNEESVAETSALDPAKLDALAAEASHFEVALADGEVAAFLLGFREAARYDNANFAWFQARYRTFLYIDRVVVGSGWRRKGLGALLYEDVERHARLAGADVLTCEVNLAPPNPRSLQFHRRCGFVEVGRQSLAAGKVVSMQLKRLVDRAGPGG
jgi:predicted GNAT superfamily acetyltransferase